MASYDTKWISRKLVETIMEHQKLTGEIVHYEITDIVVRGGGVFADVDVRATGVAEIREIFVEFSIK